MSFEWQGETCRETLTRDGKSLTPLASNIAAARKQVAEIERRINLGTFIYRDFFPESKRAEPVVENTFGDAADRWFRSKGQLEAGTKAHYASGVRLWKSLIGAEKDMDGITYQVLASLIGERAWPSAKAANNYIVSLRGIFDFHYAGPLAARNPMAGIKNLKVVKKKPDPLSAQERDLVLADLAERYDPRVAAYFRFAFFTGMRPEEIIALQWGDIDERKGTIRVERVKTKGIERDGTKTGDGREVDLFDDALSALAIMKPHTKMKSEYIFENPVTGRPWHNDASQRDHYWTPSLKRVKIRHRRAYSTRHTFATVALMAGVNPAYVARQLGHANTKMFFDTYSRWIDDADQGVQRRAMAAALSSPQPTTLKAVN